ncbi:MAG TPA: gamma-glutamyltransferase family protein [Gaiellaceae bacterium]|nr:gamma-glutamyltransferase family protein [Gaiellaceae bacterium]
MPPGFTTRPELRGTFGMVASTHWLASATGMRALEACGNAFDAAVAAGLVLQVVEPHLNGPGGDLPVILYSAERDEVIVVCGQGPSPAAATIDHYRELGLDLVPGTGLLAACVPGAFDAWMRMLLELGTASLRDVLEPAIGYARDGHPVLPRVADAIASLESFFRSEWPTSAETWLPAPAPWSLFRNPVLAETYTRILEEAEAASSDRDGQIQAARDAFYRGFVAEAIGAFCGGSEVMDSSGRRHRGLLTADDLAAFEAPFEAPVSLDYEGWTVRKTGPWGQGPVLLQQLALLEGFDLAAMGVGSADFVHTVLECSKLAFADREAWYGDPDFADVPLAELLSPEYAGERRALVSDSASAALRPGLDGPRLPKSASNSLLLAPGAGEPTRGDTCHLDVVDRFGNAVSATPSGGWLQSSPVVRELGFPLGTRAQMFWLEEGLPNSLEPRKRPRTTLSPSLAQREGQVLSFGTPGGDQQDQWSLVFFLDHVHFEPNLQAAIDLPMFHSNHFPSSFYPRAAKPRHVELEARLEPAVVDELRERGHDVEVTADWSLGRLSAASWDGGGVLRAAANARGMQGYAVGR